MDSVTACPPISRPSNSRPTSVSVQLPAHSSFIQCSTPMQTSAQSSPAQPSQPIDSNPHPHNLSHSLSPIFSSTHILHPHLQYTDMEPLLRSRFFKSVAHSHAAAPPPRIAFTRRCRSVLGLACTVEPEIRAPPATWIPTVPSALVLFSKGTQAAITVLQPLREDEETEEK